MAVAFDSVSQSANCENVSSLTWTRTPAGTPTAVGIAWAGYAGDSGTRTLTCTDGGTNAPAEIATAGDPFTTGRTPTIFGLGNPAAGAQSVVVSCAGGAMYGKAFALSVTGSDTSDVFEASNNATNAGSANASVTVTGSTADGYVIDAIATGAGLGSEADLAPDVSQTLRTRGGTSFSTFHAGSSEGGGSNVVMSWANSTCAWDLVAASFKVAGAAAASSHRVIGGGSQGRVIGG